MSLSWAKPGGIALQGAIFVYVHLCSFVSDAFLSLNFTPERCFDPANNGQTGYINSTSKIVTRKQSKADSVARKSNVNSDENVNQLTEVLKNQDTRGRQIACRTSKLSS